jgi:hypothetical protein
MLILNKKKNRLNNLLMVEKKACNSPFIYERFFIIQKD